MESRQPQLTYFISSLRVGGAERGMARILDGVTTEYNLTVIGLQGGDCGIVNELPSEVSVIDLSVKSPRDAVQLRYLWKELVKTDILVCSLFHAAIVGTILGRIARVPAVITWQHNESFATQQRQQAFGLAARLSDYVLADSEAVAEMLNQTYSLSNKKVMTVPIAGIDTNRFAPLDNSMLADGTNKEESKSLTTVGILGRLLKQKNHEAVIAAAERVTDEPIQFEIAGEGPRKSTLRRSVHEQGLNNVRFHGFVEDAPAFLNGLDVYIQPSHYEGLCLTVLEAMACELPVIGTAVGGLTETVVNGETGYLVDPGDLDQFVDRICKLHNSPVLRRQMGEQARRRVIERYSKTMLHDKFIDVLEATHYK